MSCGDDGTSHRDDGHYIVATKCHYGTTHNILHCINLRLLHAETIPLIYHQKLNRLEVY